MLATKLYKNGYSARLVARFANCYGMAKQSSAEIDDWKAYFSVQLSRYLKTKRSRKIGTDAERDMIGDLLADGYRSLRVSYPFNRLSAGVKMDLFRKSVLVFPSFQVPSRLPSETIPVDFTRKTRLSADDHCLCSSGLPYKLCCGRVPGETELLSGTL